MKNYIKKIRQSARSGSRILLGLLVMIAFSLGGCVNKAVYQKSLDSTASLERDLLKEQERTAKLELQNQALKKEYEAAIQWREARIKREAFRTDSLKDLQQVQKANLQRVKDLLAKLDHASWEAEEIDDRLIISLEDEILFETGSFKVSKTGEETIKELAQLISTELSNEVNIQITGHTDSQPYEGANFDNWDLSASRSLAVLKAFVDQGIKPWKLTSVAQGKYKPEYPNRSPEQMAKNRRTEIALSLEDIYVEEIIAE